MFIQTVNPATLEKLNSYTFFSSQKVNVILQVAQDAYESWQHTSFGYRASLFERMAEALEGQKQKYAALITQEMGKPIQESVAEIEKCALVCRYYAKYAASFLRAEDIVTNAQKSYVRFEPLGAILAIMPWNFPFWQVFRFAAPTLMAGNVALLKHAPNTTGCALFIEALFLEIGFPKGAFQTLVIDVSQVESVISSELVKAVTLTGSTKAGAAVAAMAGKYIKKSVLELGGSDPFIVLEDADVEDAVKIGVQSRMRNAGQSCIAAKRFLIHEYLFDDFVERMKQAVEKLYVGNPLDERTDVSCLARKDLTDILDKQVTKSIEQGAKLITGGTRTNNFYTPTILTNIRKGMPAYDEELFGPVAVCISFKTEAEAIAIANDSHYGLGASVWTKSIERGEKIAQKIESGNVFINSLVKSDPRLPFGGVKQSGYGRELSLWGIREFTNTKTVYVR